MDVATRAWPREARDLWQRIEAHAFEDPDITLDFTRRLARTLGWTLETARAGIEEYRRFCFLACMSENGPVTPSEEVDEVWHLHLTYTRDYWDRWCGQALGRRLHHDPTAGGPAEQARYRAQYADTLALYESWFGPPPAAFWPGTNIRFADRPRWRMVDSARSIVLPRPSWRRLRVAGLAGTLALASTPASAADTWNPLDMPGSAFLFLYICVGLLAALVSVLLRDLIRSTGRPADLHDLSPAEIGYVTGGMERAADTVFLMLAAAGVARHTDNRVIISASNGALSPELERFRAPLHGMSQRTTMIKDFAASVPGQALVAGLRRRNLILCKTRQTLLRLVTSLPVALILMLGIVKIFVGLSRNKPVLFLVILCVLTLIGLLVALGRERFLTREGEDAFESHKTRAARAIRAPRPTELALAFAFGGAAVLTGTEYAAYGKVVAPQSSSSGGCSGSGCSGGGSGCGGGGGCGGCSS